jgi:glucosamine--fructose-6-phosphate aminotransferase (isomerizing)
VCGIVGYVGWRGAFPILAEGLARLEYRGYDSAGMASISDAGTLIARWAVGRVARLVEDPGARALPGTIGIGHTRWATHGRPSVENAHPQLDCTGSIAVVHNGIIENHHSLRQWLTARGHVFRSQTDTEVIPHLIEEHAGGTFEDTVRKVMELLEGEYAIAVISSAAPTTIAAGRSGTPALLVGVGEGEHFVASDSVALAHHTRSVLPLEEGELALVCADRVEVGSARGGRPATRRLVRVGWNPDEAELGGHPHFMHKEIHEQPRAIRRTFEHRVTPETAAVDIFGLAVSEREWRDVRRVALAACGTSYHASLIGRWYFESLARIPAEVDIASEFRYRPGLEEPGTLGVFVSQSGETADTVGALRAARARGVRTVAVCNVPGSALVRDADGGVVTTAAGPEIGVASTKAFTAQVVALFLMALQAGRARGHLTAAEARALMLDLSILPARMEEVLAAEERVRALAAFHHGCRDVFFVGRGIHYPVALEGALKLKEIAYVRAEAFPGGELKHGPLALIDGDSLVLAVAPPGPTHAKMVSTIEEVRARGGQVLALCGEGDTVVPRLVEHALRVPPVHELLAPCLLAVHLQLFAYHMAVLAGRDVDRPRNLAKSVTVE